MKPVVPLRRGTQPVPTQPETEHPSEKPLGIAARIANLQLAHLNKSPEQTNAAPTPPRAAPFVPPRRTVPPPPPDRTIVAHIPTPQNEKDVELVEEEIEQSPQYYRPSPEELVRLLARKPPPPPINRPSIHDEPDVPPAVPKRRLPPMPARLPTPPPEPQPEPEPEYSLQDDTRASDTDCLKCRDFSVVDGHAAQFPRHTVSSLQNLAYDLCAPFPDETDKARAIFYWLHCNIEYDAEAFFSGNLRAMSPDDVLQSGLAVCDGYSSLFKALANFAGLECERVAGHGKGYGYTALDPNVPTPKFEMNHAWNCVLMNGSWHLIDSCWGSGHLDPTGIYQNRFEPVWFSSAPWEFVKRHFPEEPGFQLLTEEDGGSLDWEAYMRDAEGPTIFTSYYETGLHRWFLEPWSSMVPSGATVVFSIFKQCEHMSTAEEDNLVMFINLPNDTRIPLRLTHEGGWSAEVDIPAGLSGDVSLYSVKTCDHKDAIGLGVEAFQRALGRKAMSFGGLAKWTII